MAVAVWLLVLYVVGHPDTPDHRKIVQDIAYRTEAACMARADVLNAVEGHLFKFDCARMDVDQE